MEAFRVFRVKSTLYPDPEGSFTYTVTINEATDSTAATATRKGSLTVPASTPVVEIQTLDG